MKAINCLALLLALVFIFGCSAKTSNNGEAVTGMAVADQEEEEKADDGISGIRISDWYKSEKHGKDIIDIYNFDDRERVINVTTVCFDENNNLLPSDDTYVLTLPAKHQQSWVPMCPEGTASYNILIDELD